MQILIEEAGVDSTVEWKTTDVVQISWRKKVEITGLTWFTGDKPLKTAHRRNDIAQDCSFSIAEVSHLVFGLCN